MWNFENNPIFGFPYTPNRPSTLKHPVHVYITKMKIKQLFSETFNHNLTEELEDFINWKLVHFITVPSDGFERIAVLIFLTPLSSKN